MLSANGSSVCGRANGMTMLLVLVSISLVAACLMPICATRNADAWSSDPNLGIPVYTKSYGLFFAVLGDGAGGVIIVWSEGHDGAPEDTDIYAQRLDPAGSPLWGDGGVPVCTAAGAQDWPGIVSDGSGGATVAWVDQRGYYVEVYVQRLGSAGNPLWAEDGVPVCTEDIRRYSPQIASDGAGGAIVAYCHDGGIYAQRLDGLGVLQWGGSGRAVCTVEAIEGTSMRGIVADGSGGVIVDWADRRGAPARIYAQKLNSAGMAQWTDNGTPVCPATEAPVDMVSDGSGGAIFAWDWDIEEEVRDIYAQRVDSAGAARWGPNGAIICDAEGDQGIPNLVSDSAGGATISWCDFRANTNEADIYAQRVSADGIPQWSEDGLAVCTASGDQSNPRAVSDGSGGVIVAWMDARNGETFDVYAQRLDVDGAKQWAAGGVAVSTAQNSQEFPRLESDGAGGAILAWEDYRGGNSFFDIYAQKVSAQGQLGDGVTPSPWDINADHKVDYKDLAILGAHYSETTSSPYPAWDINRDGKVDYKDLAILGAHYGEVGAPLTPG